MILSVDLGTSKICAVLVDTGTARPLAIRSIANDADIPGLPVDMHEQDPLRIRELAFEVMKQVLMDERATGQIVDAIGISGQMHGVLLVNNDLKPLTNLITWRDRRTAREDTPGSLIESLEKLGTDREHAVGCRLATGYGAASLIWLQRNRLIPDNCTALSIAGFVAASLTGIPSIDDTHAASWGIYALRTNKWDDESVNRLGLNKNILPDIRPSCKPLGELSIDAANLPGINNRPVVCSPVGDAQASFIGSVGFSTDTLVVNIGTGAQILIPSPECVYGEELDAWPLPLGGFLQVGATFCGGWAYAYLKDLFKTIAYEICGMEISDEEVYERMNSLAASAPPGANGLIIDTRFSGTRKNKSITGSIAGINAANLTPANLSLALLEGLVRDLYSIYCSSTPPRPRNLFASGNAVRKNRVLRSIIQRTFYLDSFASSVPEEAARGAAYAAAVGADIISRDKITQSIQQIVDERNFE